MRKHKRGADTGTHSRPREHKTKPEKKDETGLVGKYDVFKVKDGSPVYDCFVMRPDKDPAAVAALKAYAQATDNKTLAADILEWIKAF